MCLCICGFSVPHFVLPGNGDAACGHFAVERLVFGLQLHSFHSGELLDVQHVFAVDGLRLQHTNTIAKTKAGVTEDVTPPIGCL